MVKRGSSYRCLQECLHGFILTTVSTFLLVYLLNKPLFQFSLWPDFKKLLKTTNLQSISHQISDSRESKKLLLNQLFPPDKYQYMLKPDEDEQPSKFKTELSTKMKLHQVVLPKNLSSGKSPNSKYFVQNILKQVPIYTHFFYFTTDPSGLSEVKLERLEEYLSKIDEINYFTSFSLGVNSENVDGCNESTGYILSLSVVQALLSLEPDGRTLVEALQNIGYRNPCAKIINQMTLEKSGFSKSQPETRELIREIDRKLESWGRSGHDVLGLGHSRSLSDNENSLQGYMCGDYERVFGSTEFFTTVKFQTSSPSSKITLIIPITDDVQTTSFMQYFEEGVLSRYRLTLEPKMPEINLLFVLDKNYETSTLKSFLKSYKLKYSSLNFQWIQDKNNSNNKFDFKSANELANSKLKTSHDTLLCSLSPSLHINANFIKTAFLNTRINSVIYQPGYYSSSTNKITYDPAVFCRYKVDNIDTATQTKLKIWKTADSDLISIPDSR